MEKSPRKRRMSDSELSLKPADNTVKLPYDEWLRLQRMELTAAAEKKRRELLEIEDSRRKEAIEDVSINLETLEVRNASSATENGYRREGSSDLSELQTEEPGKKSRVKLFICVLLCCILVVFSEREREREREGERERGREG